MSEGYVIAIAGGLLSIVSFFLVRWMHEVDSDRKKIQEEISELRKLIDSKLASIEDLRTNAVHRNNCTRVHQELSKAIMRERCRLNDVYVRLSEGDFVKRTPRKTFTQIGDEAEHDNNPS